MVGVSKSETLKTSIKVFKTFTFCKGKIMSCNMPSNYTTKVHLSPYNSCDYGRHAHHETLAHKFHTNLV